MTVPSVLGLPLSSDGPVPSAPGVRAYPRRAWDDPRTYVTGREREALVLAANGKTNAAISRALGVGEEAIKARMQSVLRKLRVSDRTQAVAVALRIGLLSPDEIEVPEGANRGYRDPEPRGTSGTS